MGNMKLVAVGYSPTGTTLKSLEGIRSGWGEPSEMLNITAPSDRTNKPVAWDIVVVGAPVYSGRIPKEARSFLETLKGDGRPAVAGGAFIGEHSFATEEYPTALGRSDQDDMAQAQSFGKAIREL